MNLTKQQQNFISAVLEGEHNVTLVARAGTGKTSTIIQTIDACTTSSSKSNLVCAYNKSIEIELTARLKGLGINNWQLARARTAHASGLDMIKSAFGGVEIDGKKVQNILRDPDFWNGADLNLIDKFFPQIAQLVSLAKLSGFGYFDDLDLDDNDTWFAVADHYGVNGVLDEKQMIGLFDIARKTFNRSLEQTQIVDFDDMILLPLINNLKVRYPMDRVFVDEAQDLSRARQELVKKFVRPGSGRMYVVGDDRQAIYGFSGADADALHNLTRSLRALELPLTVTWRCAKAIVREANRYVPDLEAAPNAKEGSVSHIAELPSDIHPGDAILCRFNAPLMEYAFRLIRQGIPAKVEGRNIGDGLSKLARRWKVDTISRLLDRLAEYKHNEIEKAKKRNSDTKIQEVSDRVDTLVEICHGVQKKGCHGIGDVTSAIDQIFGDDVNPKQCVVLSSVHKSKGREWDRVIFLDKQIKRELRDWQALQEQNLRYVAITRAKNDFRYLPIVDEKKNEWN
jgi:DNA helicase-2/ATP-dependent DNA helicase PcrA